MTYRFLPFGGFFSDFGQILHVIFVKCCFGCIWRDSSATLIWKIHSQPSTLGATKDQQQSGAAWWSPRAAAVS
ncbi:unnamed protein product [Acanthoscelides obtectus]|uniref:Uncharacterized protein n=1 Tax=Acanthoscelides obtectus TaxID=200917 RepID=A0A9P0KYV2_ACAOB|nr:unnamed protein product [Acanthoscelides obtectus]CAK1632819.1 hypothetical protein AOBTE_LOCUS7746 [Acanthoscelides obtectus]